MSVKDYNKEASLNVSISGINIAEGCAPSGINDAIRQLMADLKEEQNARAARDSGQDAATAAAQKSADDAQTAADAAQSTADGKAPKAHASSATTYGIGTGSNYGHVKLSDSTSSTSAASKGIAASPKAVKDAYDKAVAAIPVGSVIAFAGNPSSAPSGYLLCNGAAVSRTTYAALFEAIGTAYGAGNGSTTFNLPNMADKFIQGSGTAGTTKAAGLPNATGAFTAWRNSSSQSVGQVLQNGAISTTVTAKSSNNMDSGAAMGTSTFNMDLSKANSIYGKSTTVQPPALTMRYYIKY